MVVTLLTKKHYLIIKYLSDKDIYLTSEELAQRIGVSSRTVKRYIEDINHGVKSSGAEIVANKGVGYRLSGTPKAVQGVLKEAVRVIEGLEPDDSVESRVESAICSIIKNDCLNAGELADKLNLSTPSISKMTSKIKERLEKYNLRLISKPHYGTSIAGEELNIRSMLLDYGIKVNDNNILKIYLSRITDKDIAVVEEVIAGYLKDHDIIVSDKDFNNLLSSILVSLSRTRNHKKIQQLTLANSYRHHNYSAIYNIMTQIEQKLAVRFDSSEYIYVSFYSGFMIYNYSMKSRQEQEKDTIDQDIHDFVKELLEEIELITGNDFSKDVKFIDALTIHLKIVLNRARAGAQIGNPLLPQIKSHYPVEMNFAMFTAKKLHNYYGIKLDEDEIGFIAMHFGAAQERLSTNKRTRICILCHYGIGTAQLIAEKIKKNINYIEVAGVYPVRYLDLALTQNADYIISTSEIQNVRSSTPIIIVDNVLSDAAIKKIDTAIAGDINKQLLYEMFHQQAFYKIEATPGEQVINLMGTRMKEAGLIDGNVLDSVLERERISATDIGHMVAIPHSPIHGMHKSVIGVAILDKPILWDTYEVQLVFLICFNLAERKNLQIFKYMYNLIDDTELVKSMIKARDFAGFLRTVREGR